MRTVCSLCAVSRSFSSSGALASDSVPLSAQYPMPPVTSAGSGGGPVSIHTGGERSNFTANSIARTSNSALGERSNFTANSIASASNSALMSRCW